MRSALVLLTMLVLTPICAGLALAAAALGVPDRPGSLYWRIPHLWSRSVLRAAGVRVRVHDAERMGDGRAPTIFVSNHVSWFDVFALSAVLPRALFVAKASVQRIPIFGPGSRALGMIFIERTNRKAAFEGYALGAERIREGRTAVVFPEGTRGTSYALRPFKKGPFVFAIAAGAPIVPAIVHGTIAIMPKGSWRIRSGTIDLHLLEPVPTAGLTYEDRGPLVARVHAQMAAALRTHYGVEGDGPAGPDAGASLTFAQHA
jgi:1-acyl-sn-glycerol-3-phosphate acyltransferase